MKETFLFKIRDKNTGLYSSGGQSPTWSSKGKTWTGLGPMKCHLRQFLRLKIVDRKTDWWTAVNKIPENWEIIKIKLVEENMEILSAKAQYPDEVNLRK